MLGARWSRERGTSGGASTRGRERRPQRAGVKPRRPLAAFPGSRDTAPPRGRVVAPGSGGAARLISAPAALRAFDHTLERRTGGHDKRGATRRRRGGGSNLSSALSPPPEVPPPASM